MNTFLKNSIHKLQKYAKSRQEYSRPYFFKNEWMCCLVLNTKIFINSYSSIGTSPGQVFEDSKNISGWKHYLIRKVRTNWKIIIKPTKRILEIQEVDIAVGPLAMFASRLSAMDYSYAYSFDSYYIVIPSPQVQPNFAAPTKPFSLTVSRPDKIIFIIQYLKWSCQVWVLVLISLLSILATLSSTTWSLPTNGHGEQGIAISLRNVPKAADYVLQVLMAQGKNWDITHCHIP